MALLHSDADLYLVNFFMCYGKLCATEQIPFQAFMQEHIDWPALNTFFLGLMALPCEQDS